MLLNDSSRTYVGLINLLHLKDWETSVESLI